jgi:hypothetical protein
MTVTNTQASAKTQIAPKYPDSPLGTLYATLLSHVAASSANELFQGGERVSRGQTYACTLNSAGIPDGTAHASGWFLPTPDTTGTSAWRYSFEIVDASGNRRVEGEGLVSYSASSQNLSTILAAGASSEDADTVTVLLASKQDKDTDATDDNVAVFADGQTVDSEVALTDLATAGDITTAVSAHEADTTDVHGISDTSALLDSSDIGGTVAGQSALDSHTGNTSNPHAVTAAQVDAVPKDAQLLSKSAGYELAAGDEAKTIECNGTFTITCPDGLGAGFQVVLVNVGSGVITVAADTTLQSKDSAVTIASQYAAAVVYNRGSDVWLLMGDIE